MTLTVMTILTLAVVLAVTLGLLVRSLAKQNNDRSSDTQWSQQWFEEFSASDYRLMKRLLSEDEFRFLSRQAGYTAELGRKLRKERRNIFRMYLKNLKRDFNRLYTGATILMVYSDIDRPELASALFSIRINFYAALVRVNLRLAMHAFGLEMMDVTPMLQSLEFLQVRVRSLQPEVAAC